MQTRAIPTNEIIGTAKSFLTSTNYHTAGEERVNHQNAVMNVLKRAALDKTFRTALLFSGTKALEHYKLTGPEKAALISGDIKWIEKKIGMLKPVQKCWPLHRLEAEVW